MCRKVRIIEFFSIRIGFGERSEVLERDVEVFIKMVSGVKRLRKVARLKWEIFVSEGRVRSYFAVVEL